MHRYAFHTLWHYVPLSEHVLLISQIVCQHVNLGKRDEATEDGDQ
jgi:hypothetical protein